MTTQLANRCAKGGVCRNHVPARSFCSPGLLEEQELLNVRIFSSHSCSEVLRGMDGWMDGWRDGLFRECREMNAGLFSVIYCSRPPLEVRTFYTSHTDFLMLSEERTK
ncbi:hypothetical protein AOLI_G00136710 [Acnodon oligacanthus]